MSLLLALTGGGTAVNYTLTCDAGAYSYVGNDAVLTVTRNYTLQCDAGNYLYQGNDAILIVKHNYVLECEPGAYVYTGNDATLIYEPGVVNYDTHDGGDEKKRVDSFRKKKELLREQLNEAIDAAHEVQMPVEVEKVQQAIPVALTKEDIAEVTSEVNLLITQIYMRIAMEKAARQDEDDVAIVMLMNG